MYRAIAVIFAGMLLAGCASPAQQQNTIIGAGVGAGVGALIGSTTGNVVAGAIIGGVAGGVIGAVITPGNCYITNRRGEIWQVPCEYMHRFRAQACFYGVGPAVLEPTDCRGYGRRSA